MNSSLNKLWDATRHMADRFLDRLPALVLTGFGDRCFSCFLRTEPFCRTRDTAGHIQAPVESCVGVRPTLWRSHDFVRASGGHIDCSTVISGLGPDQDSGHWRWQSGLPFKTYCKISLPECFSFGRSDSASATRSSSMLLRVEWKKFKRGPRS